MLFLLFVFSSICLLHITQLPVGMWFFCPLVIAWRIQILRERLAQPSRALKLFFASILCVSLFFQYSQWVAVESTVGLLLVALTLKLLEIRGRRDVLVILFLYYFLVACGFLFEQSVIYSIVSVVVVILITAVLVLLHCVQNDSSSVLGSQTFQLSARQYANQSLKDSVFLSSKLLFQSVFLALIMLLFLPRINPLWTVPLHSDTAITGVSDSMSPGDISSLIQSNALAFRVTFIGDVIPNESMYWRGLVFDDFDGRRWQRSEPVSQSVQAQDFIVPTIRQVEAASGRIGNNAVNSITEYEVLLEATGHNWLYAIPEATITQGVASPIYSPQGEIFQSPVIGQRVKYQVRSQQKRKLSSLSNENYRRFTYIPPKSNLRSQRIAREWWQQSSGDEEYIQRVLSYYRENFTYTLSPPTLGRDTVDDFLFDTQEGFCEHFSSSFTVLMRAAGIPARVVVGYQGGTWVEGEGYLQVYQRDAHAWTEVWLRDKGWLRIDPTAAVAEIRIREGVSAALPQRERVFVGNSSLNSYRWLKNMHQQWSTIDYRWQRWVLDYDSDKQQSILDKYFGKLTITKVVIAVFSTLMLAAAFIGFGIFRNSLLIKYMQKTPEKKLYLLLQKKLKKLGIAFDKNRSLKCICARAMNELPVHKNILSSVYADLEELFYRPDITVDEVSKIYMRAKKNIKTL